jgi:hypothetical protein
MERIGWTDMLKKKRKKSRRKGIPDTKYEEENLTGLAISCVETAF